MTALRRLRCRLVGLWENASFAAFWTSGGNISVAAHEWPWPFQWTEPRESEWGLVQYEILDCPRCGFYREGPDFRRYYGS